MSGELTAADVSWRARTEAVIQDALRGATVTDSAVSVSEDGSVKIVYLEGRRPDGRVVISEQGYRMIGNPRKGCPGDEGRCMDDQEIRISLDGNQWCALRGANLQEGESGFGPTPAAALADLLNAAAAPEFEAVRRTLEKIQELAVHPGVKCRGKDCRLCPAGVSEGRILVGCALLSIYSVAMRQLTRTQQGGS